MTDLAAQHFPWMPFYAACSQKLLAWEGHALYQAVRKISAGCPLMHYLHFENEDLWKERNFEIDPFSVLAIFNRGVTAEHRKELAMQVARMLGVDLDAPSVFHGIPHLDPRKSIYNGNSQMRDLFEKAMRTDAPDEIFASAWDAAIAVKGNALGTLSIALFWAAPERFMPVDAISAPYIKHGFGLDEPDGKCGGQEYVEYMRKLRQATESSFPAIALAAWTEARG